MPPRVKTKQGPDRGCEDPARWWNLVLATPSLDESTTDANTHTYCREAGGCEDGFDLVDLLVSMVGCL